jgi:DNA primase
VDVNNEAVREIKARLDIVDMVRRYVELRPVSGRWMGPCPFHQETKPSMSVNGEEGFFYCFGCQAAGDVITFYQRINGLDFKEALEQLAQEAGVELKGFKPDPQAADRKREKNEFLEMHQLALEYFRRNLTLSTGVEAQGYLNRRGIRPETVEAFGLGVSPDDWHGLLNFLKARGHAPERAAAAGLLSSNEKGNIYDRFRGRLIFPIHNLSGQVIAFGGRILEKDSDAAKYINSSDSPIYKKGEHLYGLFQARGAITRSKRALITEGYMDVLSLHQFGFTDSCGVLGTALTPDQIKRLSGFCSRVDMVFDGDGAGRKAAFRAAEMILAQGLSCRAVPLPDGEDVDSLLQARGAEGFRHFLDQAREGLEFCLATLRDTGSPKEIVEWATGFLGKLGDPLLRGYFLPRVAQGLGLSEGQLRAETENRAESRAGQRAGRAAGRDGAPREDFGGGPGGGPDHGRGEAPGSPGGPGWPRASRVAAPGKEERDDRLLLRFVIQHPDYVPELAARGLGELFATDFGRSLWSRLAANAPEDVMVHLSDEEKSFYAASRLTPGISGQDLEDEWAHVLRLIEEHRLDMALRQVKERLRAAQGDMSVVRDLLAEQGRLQARRAELSQGGS